jgi:site-specific recombinase XerD
MSKGGRPPKGAETLWSYSTGRRGRDRVRVYEPRREGALMIAYTTPGGDLKREALAQFADRPVYCKATAERMARAISSRLAIARDEDQLRGFLGISSRRTLHELLAAFHAVRVDSWSAAHRNDQLRWQQLFLTALGPTRTLDEITPGDVEMVVAEDLGHLSASRKRKALVYIGAAFRYAQLKLKWITAEDNLSALHYPRVESNLGDAYSLTEFRHLIPALGEVDLRAGFLGRTMRCTGRRLNAVKQLRVTDCSKQAVELPSGETREVWILRFASRYDKPRKDSRIPLNQDASEILESLLRQPAVQATGLLFPEGDLANHSTATRHRGELKQRKVISHCELIAMLRDAEARAGIKHVHGRAYHGIKRSVVTQSLADEIPIDVVAALCGTAPNTLRNHYNKLDRDVARLLEWVERRPAVGLSP